MDFFFEAGKCSGFLGVQLPGKDTKTCRTHPLSKKIGTVHPEIHAPTTIFFPLSTSNQAHSFFAKHSWDLSVGFLVVILLDKFTISIFDNKYYKPCQLEIAKYFCDNQYTSDQYKPHAKRCLTKAMAGYLNKNRGRARKEKMQYFHIY